jgi:hypothetical protein
MAVFQDLLKRLGTDNSTIVSGNSSQSLKFNTQSVGDNESSLFILRQFPPPAEDPTIVNQKRLTSIPLNELIEYDSPSNPMTVDYFGILGINHNKKLFKQLETKELSRVPKWMGNYKAYTNDHKSLIVESFLHPKLFSRVVKGIPRQLRGAVWSELIGLKSGLYKNMTRLQIIQFETKTLETYEKISLNPDEYLETQIIMLLKDTMPYHIMYFGSTSTTEELIRLSKAIILYFPQVGLKAGIIKWSAMILTLVTEQVYLRIILDCFFNCRSFTIKQSQPFTLQFKHDI